MARVLAGEEEVYPAIPETFLERTPKDVRKELGKFVQSCPYRVRVISCPELVRIVIESYDSMSHHIIGWPPNPANAVSVGALLNFINTGTTGSVRMLGNMILTYQSSPVNFGTFYIYEPNGRLSLAGFTYCPALGRALRDVHAILSAL